jgi:hypothetical protein
MQTFLSTYKGLSGSSRGPGHGTGGDRCPKEGFLEDKRRGCCGGSEEKGADIEFLALHLPEAPFGGQWTQHCEDTMAFQVAPGPQGLVRGDTALNS